jgi:hypothetical protein
VDLAGVIKDTEENVADEKDARKRDTLAYKLDRLRALRAGLPGLIWRAVACTSN